MLSPLHNCWFSGRCPPVLHIRIPKQHAGAERLFPVQLQKFLCFRGNIDDTLQESTVQHADSFCLCHQFHRTGGKPRAQCRGFPKHQQQCVRAEEQPVLGRIFLMCRSGFSIRVYGTPSISSSTSSPSHTSGLNDSSSFCRTI